LQDQPPAMPVSSGIGPTSPPVSGRYEVQRSLGPVASVVFLTISSYLGERQK
jgi:carboxymethylenebutenolidase